MKQSNNKTTRVNSTKSSRSAATKAKPVRKGTITTPKGCEYEYGLDLGSKPVSKSAAKPAAASGKKKPTQSKAKTSTKKKATSK